MIVTGIIGAGGVVTITFQKVDDVPCAKTGLRAITRIFRVSIALAKKAIKFLLSGQKRKKRPCASKGMYIKHRGGIGEDKTCKDILFSGRITNPQWNLLIKEYIKSPPYMVG